MCLGYTYIFDGEQLVFVSTFATIVDQLIRVIAINANVIHIGAVSTEVHL
jgi:hypothetical protein